MNEEAKIRLQPSYWFQFLYLLWVIFACAFLMSMVGIFIIKTIYKVNLLDITAAFSSFESNPKAVIPVKIFQLFSSVGMFMLPPFVFLVLRKQSSSVYLKMEKIPSSKSVAMGILLLIFSIPLLSLIIDLNKQMVFPDFLHDVEYWMRMQELQLEKVTRIFLEMSSMNDFLFNMLVIGIVPAMGEELLFRGVVQKIFGEWTKNIHWGIWISAFIFSAIHLQFYGFFPRMLLGVLLGYMFFWSGNLWVPILAHFFNNGSQVLLSYLFQQGVMKTNIDEIDTFPIYITIIFSVLFVVLLFRFYKTRTE